MSIHLKQNKILDHKGPMTTQWWDAWSFMVTTIFLNSTFYFIALYNLQIIFTSTIPFDPLDGLPNAFHLWNTHTHT